MELHTSRDHSAFFFWVKHANVNKQPICCRYWWWG